MHILHCSPLGMSKLGDFIKCLQIEMAAGEAGKTALILPSPHLLEQARNQLSKTGLTAWEFPRILSLDELAAMLSGLRKISRVEQELLLEQILSESKIGVRFPCFEGIVRFSGFVSGLARLFDEFKMAAVTPDELEAVLEMMAEEAGEISDRDAAIAFLFRQYQEKMVEYSLVDIAGTYLLATEALSQEDVELPFEKILMAEFSVLSPVRLQLIAGLQRRVPIEIGICYEKNRQELFSAVEPVVQALLGLNFFLRVQAGDEQINHSLAHVRGHLFEPVPTVKIDASGIKMLISSTRAKETAIVADQIKAWLLSTGRHATEVALVVKDPDAYPQLIEVFTDRGIPVDLAEQVPTMQRALSRLIFAWLELIMGSGKRTEFIEVIKSPFIRQRLNWDPDLLEKRLQSEVVRNWKDLDAAILRQAPNENLARQWRDCLSELLDQAEQWDRPEKKVLMIDCFRCWLQWMDVPASLLNCRKAGTLGLLEVRAELIAWQQVLSAADEMENIFAWLTSGQDKFALAEFAALLRRMLSSNRVNLRDRQEGGIQVVTPGAASGMKFPLVFILGLTEGEFPAQPRESWLYGDGERRLMAELGLPLSTVASRSSMENFNFALSIAMATEELVLSSVTDGETLASRYPAEISRLFTDSAILQESFGVHQIVVEAPVEAKSSAELFKAILRHHGQKIQPAPGWTDLLSSIRCELPPGLEQRIEQERSRSGPYAGIISAELIEQSRFSPSALERYARCPFAYFVTDLMGIEGWKTAGEGIDALSAGSIWHEILAAFMATHKTEKLIQAETDSYVREIGILLDSAVIKREQQGRLAAGIWWRFERPRWEKEIRRWLLAELERQKGNDILPRFFEWGFNMVWDQQPGQIELLGKIDRIDSGQEIYRVIDYKTGQLPANKQVLQGICLQVPVYMMAVEQQLFEEKMTGEGIYSSVGRDGKDFILPGKNCSKEELFVATRKFVTRWTDGIRSGLFPARPVADCPPYCIASAFCRFCGESNQEEPEELSDD